MKENNDRPIEAYPLSQSSRNAEQAQAAQQADASDYSQNQSSHGTQEGASDVYKPNWVVVNQDAQHASDGAAHTGAQSAQTTQPMSGGYAQSAQPNAGYEGNQAAQAQASADRAFSYASSPHHAAGASTTSPQNENPYAQTVIPPLEAKPKKKKTVSAGFKNGLKTFLIAFAGSAVAFLLLFAVFGGFSKITGTTQIGSSSSTVTSSDTPTTLAEEVAEKCLPSVVGVDIYTRSSSSSSLYDYYFGNGKNSSSSELTESALGSGVVLSADGYIITNYHVVEGAAKIVVTIEGTEYEADLVGSDESSDIAVLKAKNASGLTPIELGDSDSLRIGEWVMSIGSPFGLEQSVATGIVSATCRSQIVSSSSSSSSYSGSSSYMIYPNMIQTDAAINPGNSGGALVDANGKLIGINTLITSYSGNYSGVGFAIPVNYAVNLAKQIIDGKTPSHAALGVSMTTVNSQTAQRYGLSVSEGAYVTEVTSGSGADAAGLKQGDIIVKLDSTTIASSSDLMLAVRAKNPGDQVEVTVNRNGTEQTFTVTLGSDA